MIRKTRTSGSHVNPMDFCLLNLIWTKKLRGKFSPARHPASLLAQSCPQTEVISRIRNLTFLAVKETTQFAFLTRGPCRSLQGKNPPTPVFAEKLRGM